MNRDTPAGKSAKLPKVDSSLKGSVRRIVLMLSITFVVLFLLDPYLFMPFFLILWPLITGPYFFLERTIPKIHTAAESAAFLALILLILMVMTHHFFKWLYAGWKSKTANAGQHVRAWRWKWTALLTAAMLISLVTTMSLVAFAHQAGWLMKTDEKFVRRKFYYAYIRSTANYLSAFLSNEDWNSKKAPETIAGSLHGFGNFSAHHWDDFEAALVYDRDGSIKRVLVLSRVPEIRKKAGFVAIGRSSTSPLIPIEKLEDYLNPDFVPPDLEN